jgi:alkylhydroperoxidase family enzyme
MAWIKTVSVTEATGAIKSFYDAAIKRAGRVFNIVGIMSLNPPVLRASMGFYRAVMFEKSPLTRCHRELLATVVSRANECRY